MLIVIFRAMIVWSSFLGYCFFLKARYRLNIFLAPAVTLGSIGTVMFLAGLFNIMKLAALGICAGGLVCIFLCLRNRKTLHLEKWDFAGLAILTALTGLLALRLLARKLVDYDDFSHWLIVVKDMLENNRMPTCFSSEIINFKGYPTGIAGVIYYFSKLIGLETEGLFMTVQGLVILASLYTLMSGSSGRGLWSWLLAAAGSLFLLTFPYNGIETLLVDSLLGCVCLASLAVIVRYREDPPRAFLFSLPIQIFLAVIKNSGILLMLMNSCVFLYFLVKMRKTDSNLTKKKIFGAAAAYSMIPVGIFFLWTRHVDMVFDHGMFTSRHSISFYQFRSIVCTKTAEDIRQTVVNLFDRIFSWDIRWMVLLLICGILLLVWCSDRQRKSGALAVFIGGSACYWVYMLGMGLMYIFSMPGKDAVQLPAFERYEMTVLIYIAGAVFLYGIYAVDRLSTEKSGSWNCAGILICAGLMLTLHIQSIPELLGMVDSYEGTDRAFLDAAISGYEAGTGTEIAPGSSIILYGPDLSQGGYHWYLGRYLFWTPDVTISTPERLPEMDRITEDDRYLVILEEDEEIDRFLLENDMEPGQSVYFLPGTLPAE